MKIKQSGVWKDGKVLTKNNQLWSESKETLIKVGGDYKEFGEKPLPPAKLFRGIVTVGAWVIFTTNYGYNRDLGGSISSNVDLYDRQINALTYFTANGEIAIAYPDVGAIPSSQHGDMTLNGVIYKFKRMEHISGFITMLFWAAPVAPPLTGTWDIVI